MNQVQGGSYYYQPSYNSYQTPSMGQGGEQSYNSSATYNQSYYRPNQSESYSAYSYNTPKTYSPPCMGSCNPPKLYADTYNYLTENLMKPVIQEVYHDLKNITSANTVANHSLASNIGLNDQAQAQSVPESAQSVPQGAQSVPQGAQV